MNLRDALSRQLAPLLPWWRWWTEELRLLWDDVLLRVWPAARVISQVRVENDELILVQKRGKDVVHSERIPIQRQGGTLTPLCSELAPSFVPDSSTTLILAPRDSLIRRIRLPAAVEPHLRDTLRLRLEREMPIAADAAYFDYLIAGRAAEAATIDVDLAVAKRGRVDAWVSCVNACRLKLRAVAVGEGRDAAFRFNLLSASVGPQLEAAHRWDRWLLAIAGVLSACLIAVTLWQWRAERRDAAVALQAIQPAAEAARGTLVQLENRGDMARALEAQMKQPQVGSVMSELTRIVPDDAWLQLFRFSASEMQLTGVSSSASTLVALLEQSRLFERVSLSSTASNGLGTGQDRFEISLHTSAVDQP